MYPCKQSTALDVVFFAHDSSGNPVTGKVDGNWTKNISKAAAAFGAMTVTITERAGGWYHMQLSTAHTDTLGILSIYLVASGVVQVNLQFRVFANVFDDLFAAAAMSELSQAAPPATPTPAQALMLLYMALRNALTETSTLLTISNDAGTVVAKAALSDDGSTFTRAEMASGP